MYIAIDVTQHFLEISYEHSFVQFSHNQFIVVLHPYCIFKAEPYLICCFTRMCRTTQAFILIIVYGWAIIQSKVCGLLSQLLHQRIVNKMQVWKWVYTYWWKTIELRLKDTVLTPIGSIGSSKSWDYRSWTGLISTFRFFSCRKWYSLMLPTPAGKTWRRLILIRWFDR